MDGSLLGERQRPRLNPRLCLLKAIPSPQPHILAQCLESPDSSVVHLVIVQLIIDGISDSVTRGT